MSKIEEKVDFNNKMILSRFEIIRSDMQYLERKINAVCKYLNIELNTEPAKMVATKIEEKAP